MDPPTKPFSSLPPYHAAPPHFYGAASGAPYPPAHPPAGAHHPPPGIGERGFPAPYPGQQQVVYIVAGGGPLGPRTADQIWGDPASWQCGRYYGQGDERLCVPNPDQCGRDPSLPNPNRGGCAQNCCAPVTPNHAHPVCRRLTVALAVLIVAGTVVRILLQR